MVEEEKIAKNLLLDRTCDNCYYSWDCEHKPEVHTCEKWNTKDLKDLIIAEANVKNVFKKKPVENM